MPVSALVLTLTAEPEGQAAVFDALQADARLLLGPLQAHARLPVVTETASLQEGADLMREILGVQGVVHVDVIRVDFDDVRDFDEAPPEGRRRRRRLNLDHEALAGGDLLAWEGLEDELEEDHGRGGALR